MGLNVIGDKNYVSSQIKKHLNLLHDLSEEDISCIEAVLPATFSAVEECWSEISNRYYSQNGVEILDINNSNQYAQLLLIFAHQVSKKGCSTLADKIFGLNKMLNSCDIYHEVVLPKSFYIDHTLGVIVGRAQLRERLFLSQNCTIGSDPGRPEYPVLGRDNYLMANATLVGNVKTGDRVIFAAGSFVKDITVPSDSIVFGRSPENIIKPLKPESYKKASPFRV